jgi:hypothetical protein
MPAGSNNFRVGGQLLVKDRECQSDRLFDEHTNQNTFGRPVGKRSVDLSAMLDLALLLLRVGFCD